MNDAFLHNIFNSLAFRILLSNKFFREQILYDVTITDIVVSYLSLLQ